MAGNAGGVVGGATWFGRLAEGAVGGMVAETAAVVGGVLGGIRGCRCNQGGGLVQRCRGGAEVVRVFTRRLAARRG